MKKNEVFYNEKGEMGVLIGRYDIYSMDPIFYGFTENASSNGGLKVNIDKRIIDYYLINPTVEDFVNYIKTLGYDIENIFYYLRMRGSFDIDITSETVNYHNEEVLLKDLKIKYILHLKFVQPKNYFTITALDHYEDIFEVPESAYQSVKVLKPNQIMFIEEV